MGYESMGYESIRYERFGTEHNASMLGFRMSVISDPAAVNISR